MRGPRVYLLLAGAAFRAEFQYRGNLFINIIGGLFYQGVGLAFIWAVLDRFGQVGGWGLGKSPSSTGSGSPPTACGCSPATS